MASERGGWADFRASLPQGVVDRLVEYAGAAEGHLSVADTVARAIDEYLDRRGEVEAGAGPGETRRLLGGYIRGMPIEGLPEGAPGMGACPLETSQVMEAVAQAAAGGAGTVLVAMKPDGRGSYGNVAVAFILPPGEYARLIEAAHHSKEPI